MEPLALGLVLVGSVLHLGWNVLAKGAADKLAFLWLALLIPALAGVGFLVVEIHGGDSGRMAWICLFASSVVHIFYFWSLANAYQYADLSFVYPYCRGIGALLATMVGVGLLGERPSLLGLSGVALTIVATALEPLIASRGHRFLSRRGIGLTVATGVAIATYLVIDKIGVGEMSPLSYLSIMFLGMALGLLPAMLKNQRFLEELRVSRAKPFIASVFMASGYGVVLAAMTMAPVSYVVAARATGIVVSGIAGVLFFQEQVSQVRWISIALITLGVVLIGIS